MKKFLISSLLATLIMIPAEIFAADFDTPHTFSAGDTISADMMNELFLVLKSLGKDLSSSDLVGTWNITNTTNVGNSMTGGTSNDANGMTKTRTDTVTFSDDGDGSFSWSQTNYSSFLRHCGDVTNNCSNAGSGHYAIINGIALFQDTVNYGNDVGKWLILGKGNIQIIMVSGLESNNTDIYMVKLDKINLPPTTPATLTASASGKTVSLAWTDSSTDETGFKVLRKNSLTGSYSTVTTTSADATS